MINLCFTTGYFPDVLKNAHVRALYKKGEKDHEENYRPISLLSNVSKIFEKIISSRFIEFFERHSLLSDRQNGYRKGKSTIRAIYQALEKILNSLNNNNKTLAMCIDLSKAFDRVNHQILCKKLEIYGVRGVALDLIRSYLEGRTQQVIEYNDHGTLWRSKNFL